MQNRANHNQSQLTALLIDNEPDARTALRILLREHPQIQIIGEAADVPTAASLIRFHQPDLIFLDVEMGGQTGFDLLSEFPAPAFQVVFCTGFEQFALRAIKQNALDYLMKPVDPDELELAVEKATRQKQAGRTQRIALRTGEEICLVEPREICHIESDGAYTTVRLCDGRRFVQARSLREFEEMLPTGVFLRIHQSFLVNLSQVEKFFSEKSALAMRSGREIPVARRRKLELLEALGLS